MNARRARGLGVALVAATLAGVAVARATPMWQALPAAPTSIRMDGLSFVDANHGWVGSAEGWIYRTTDGGASWTLQLNSPTNYIRCVEFADMQNGWAGTLNSGAILYHTSNGGDTWTPVPNLPDLKPNAVCGIWVASPRVIYCVGSYSGPARMLKSADGGLTWTSKDLAPLAGTLVDVYFRNDSVGFAVGGVGAFGDTTRSVVLQTTNGGATWTQRYVGNRLGEWGWKISFPTPTIGYVSLERNQGPMFLLKTIDGGSTWSELPFEDYNEQGIGFATPDIGWIGGYSNPTFGTTDGGATWNPTPWGDYIDRFQFVVPTLGYATGVTVYRYQETALAVPGAGTARPRSLAAPNPFVNHTTIRFSLRGPIRVQLFIADPAGRIVRSLEDGPRGAGTHVVEWDGRDDRGTPAPAGIYLYVLHAGDQHEMGKLVRVP